MNDFGDHEVWVRIKGFKNYDVSNLGNVRSFSKYKKGNILKPQTAGGNGDDKYLIVRLYRNVRQPDGTIKKEWKVEYIHRLVLMAFRGPPTGEKNQTNHINGDKLDNRLENLEWCTPKENIRHAFENGLSTNEHLIGNRYGGKLSEDEAKEIYRRITTTNVSREKIADEYGVTPETITNIKNGTCYRDVSGYTDKLIDAPRKGARLCGRKALEIYKRLWNGETAKTIANEIGFSINSVYAIKHGRSYNHITGHKS